MQDTESTPNSRDRIEWLRVLPFLAMHVACLAVVWVGASTVAVLTVLFVVYVRVFGLTAFYHRYFSHKAFKTSRWFQFVGAFIGCAAAQRGPLWWASPHRNHHRWSDRPQDVHITWYLLALLSRLGIVWDLHGVPERVLSEARANRRVEERGK